MRYCKRTHVDAESDPSTTTSSSGLVSKDKRKCRDVFCCLLFIVYWIGMAVIAYLALQTGKPLSLIYGRDYNSSICGDGSFVDKKYTAYPRLDQDLLDATLSGTDVTNMQFFGVCVSSCPDAGDEICTYDNSSCWVTAQPTTAVFFRCLPEASQNETVVAETCLDPVEADVSCTNARFLSGECDLVCHTKRVQKLVWEVDATTTNPLIEQLQGYMQVFGRFLSDMNAAKQLLLVVGGAGAMVLGIIWLVMLQFFAGCIIWLTCWLVFAVLVLMSLFCSVRSGLISSEDLSGLSFLNGTGIDTSSATSTSSDDTTKLQFKVAAYIMWIATVILFLLVLAMRKRIHIAIAIIRESSRAIQQLPLLLLWPIIPSVFFILLVLYGVAIAAYLLSSDDLTSVVEQSTSALATITNTTVNATLTEEMPAKTTQQVLLAYHTFGFLWMNQLIQAISMCVIAGAITQYYWTVPDTNGKRKLDARFPIARALRYTLRFSLGSLCFGSCIIALVQFARLLLEYLDQNTKKLQQSNKIVKVVFLSVRCCLWCFEKCLKFLSKNAYIIIAMKGSSFCTAAVHSFKLLFHNLARVAVVNSISFFLLFLVKITITLIVGVIVFATLSSSNLSSLDSLVEGPVTSPMAPVLVACILAWLVASAFANVYDSAIDTILLCFCEDTELHGEHASEFMSKELRGIMGGGEKTLSSTSKIHQGSVIKVTAAKPNVAGNETNPSNKVHVDTEI